MMNYMQTNILDMLEYVGEDNCQKILSTFACPLNTDVEDFIRTKAIQFAKQKIDISYLVFAEQDTQRYFVGYYTLANKFICVNSSSLSKTVYIECNNQPKLFDFYSATGFFPFDERVRQTDDPNDADTVFFYG